MRSRLGISGFGFRVGGTAVKASDESLAPATRNPKSRRANLADATRVRNGFTLLEIIIVITILSVLTAAAVPMVRNSVKREREAELRIALRQIRQAIDRYKKFNDDTNGAAIPIEFKTQSGYPKTLELLAEGFIPANVVGTSGAKVRFLRKLPVDPMTDKADWGKRSYKDDPTSTSWGSEDVFDVYSRSDGVPLNGVGKYRDW
jgi:general secretion pathway protein G